MSFYNCTNWELKTQNGFSNFQSGFLQVLLENFTFYLIILSTFIALKSDPSSLFYSHYRFYFLAQCKECK